MIRLQKTTGSSIWLRAYQSFALIWATCVTLFVALHWNGSFNLGIGFANEMGYPAPHCILVVSAYSTRVTMMSKEWNSNKSMWLTSRSTATEQWGASIFKIHFQRLFYVPKDCGFVFNQTNFFRRSLNLHFFLLPLDSLCVAYQGRRLTGCQHMLSVARGWEIGFRLQQENFAAHSLHLFCLR